MAWAKRTWLVAMEAEKQGIQAVEHVHTSNTHSTALTLVLLAVHDRSTVDQILLTTPTGGRLALRMRIPITHQL